MLKHENIFNDNKQWSTMGTVWNPSRNKSLTCAICGKNFEDQLTLDAHKKLEHSMEGESPAGVG
jgi:hypothetical protein